MQIALQRAGAVHRVEALIDDHSLGAVGYLKLQGLVGQPLSQRLHQIVDNTAEIILGEGLEHDYLVQPVEKLRPESPAQLLVYGLLCLGGNSTVGIDTVQQVLAAQIAGEDDDGVFEVHRAALGISYAPVVQYLQKYIEHVRVSLFHLVEKHHGIGLSPDGLGELAALVIAHISGRRADKAADGEFLHILGHIDTHKIVLVVKKALGQTFGQLRFAHARGAKEHEGAYGPVGVGYTRSGAEYGLGDFLHGLVLTDDPLMDYIVQMQKLFPLALHEL